MGKKEVSKDLVRNAIDRAKIRAEFLEKYRQLPEETKKRLARKRLNQDLLNSELKKAKYEKKLEYVISSLVNEVNKAVKRQVYSMEEIENKSIEEKEIFYFFLRKKAVDYKIDVKPYNNTFNKASSQLF